MIDLSETLNSFNDVGVEARRNTTSDRQKQAAGAAVAGNGKNANMVNLRHPATKDMMLVRTGTGGTQQGEIVLNRSHYALKADSPLKTRTTDASNWGHNELNPSFLPRYKISADKTTETLDNTLVRAR